MNQEFWQDRKVFVTGATGFLGGWIVRQLLDLGAEVIALVRDSPPQSMFLEDGLIDRVTVVPGSVCDPEVLRRAIAEYSVRTVFHLAAQPLVGVANLDPTGTLEVNVRGTWNLLEAARQIGVGEVIVASSDKAYGSHVTSPYRETHPLQGKFPYDVSKSCADLIAGMYATTYNIPVAITRCANIFGGGDLNFSRTIPGVIKSTLHGLPLEIRSDGNFVRDFVYVKDAVRAYLMLAEHLAANRSLAGRAFNFSLEIRETVLSIVHHVLRLMDREDLEPVILNIASAEIREQYMCSELARQELGWFPEYDLERGLLETIDWYRAHFQRQSIALDRRAAASRFSEASSYATTQRISR